jgi:hypothetical protein
MGKKNEKLLQRFLSKPKDFEYRELVTLLMSFGYEEKSKGKTSGSRVLFVDKDNKMIMLDIPHPAKILKQYQLKGIADKLKEHEYID